ncbi:YafY family protein [Paracoccus sp. 228]|uniref:helix-turn-helix transcriptional regulator n=1 Tax=Paracoccus sp. 228 TaxID=1192054 RepID=UPI0005FA7FA3|nr:WYL domain-containing protein [Paracoccus sp. 228]
MADDLRYEKLDVLMRLALRMQASADGITLTDIAEESGKGHRTAQRMKEALIRAFPQIEETIDPDTRRVRLKLPHGTLGRLSAIRAEEISALHRAAEVLRREGDAETADMLATLSDRVVGAVDRPLRARLDPDIEALMEADGVALRPGPHESLDPAIMAQLRKAILHGCWIIVSHRTRGGQLTWNTRLGPLGMLLGQGRQYLVAFSDYADAVRLFALSGFEKVEITGDAFTQPDGFSLQSYAHNSFGVWQEPPEDIVWHFSAKVSRDAATYRFHPTATHEPQPDGSLIVRFRAGGLQEMVWHLARWGGEVQVLAPKRLRDMLHDLGRRLTEERVAAGTNKYVSK